MNDMILPDLLEIIPLVSEKKYDEALTIINDYISLANDEECKNTAAMMSLQILALAGYGEIASVLLKALLKKFKIHSQAKGICKRTIVSI